MLEKADNLAYNELRNEQVKQTANNDYPQKKKLFKKISNGKTTVIIGIISLIFFLLPHYFIGLLFAPINLITIFAGIIRQKKAKKMLAQYDVTEEDRTTYAKESKKARKIYATVSVAIVLIVLLVLGINSCGERSSGGDGITTCRNCGREKELVPGFGYCNTCYKGFVDWQEKNWTKGK